MSSISNTCSNSGGIEEAKLVTNSRYIDLHKVLNDNTEPDISVSTENSNKGIGGVFNTYIISHVRPADQYKAYSTQLGVINFQTGTVTDNGVNGVTEESLLAIVLDRLLARQAGQFPTYEVADAIGAVNSALAKLKIKRLNEVAEEFSI